MLEGTVMLWLECLFFKFPFTGSLLLFYPSLFVFVSAISGVGLFISSLSSTQQQAMLGTFVFMIPHVTLRFCHTPLKIADVVAACHMGDSIKIHAP